MPPDQHRARASLRNTPHSRNSTASASVQHAAPQATVEAARSAPPSLGFFAVAMQQQQLDARGGTASEGTSSHSQLPPSTQAQQSLPVGYSLRMVSMQPQPLQEHQNPAQIVSPGAGGKDRERPTVDLIQSDFRQTHAGSSMEQHSHHSAVAAPPPPLQKQGSDIHASDLALHSTAASTLKPMKKKRRTEVTWNRRYPWWTGSLWEAGQILKNTLEEKGFVVATTTIEMRLAFRGNVPVRAAWGGRNGVNLILNGRKLAVKCSSELAGQQVVCRFNEAHCLHR
uniref:Uncharacterized protein n=1 Tax=Chromera velia CCMP2878 TaxID=1169474 RepID=A0A0K6S9N4_9ALVE|eukprot:Cvel_7755.t2-p1 / transcript=Cvel_7755.t2 / gene=Cvel_7755 / organism=Chromera_velia_CCMP2878 / gene_product=hypothetical protein / transcript_product=hypothetical protein / location=Cvel_scaffold413:16756-18942(-) / protein_length=282 / sequence_SO=supercontig / SO=protein_coding / is_pseudo=false